ncbi:unnamed protein product [Pseudo-nitzschia multistriata]|uniref:Uncharacterized protein n=1 Tax=Pseudo-nitzschia multistriata TaxID=183589 RepID=A0A448ZC94_9STRA|nr:unnamed protein product [Pseudo-nitzschia multistriata]
MATTMPVDIISPDPGKTSPATVAIDVTASYPNGVRELKQLLQYNEQLYMPEELMMANDSIKVWNLDDDEDENPAEKVMFRNDPFRVSQEARRMLINRVSIEESTDGIHQDHRLAAAAAAAAEMVVEETKEDLMSPLYIPSEPIAPATEIPRRVSSTLPPRRPSQSPMVLDRGTTRTVVLDNDDLDIGRHAQPGAKEPNPRPSHRRRGHRRNHSHFDFQF